jgi:hypothetical protein
MFAEGHRLDNIKNIVCTLFDYSSVSTCLGLFLDSHIQWMLSEFSGTPLIGPIVMAPQHPHVPELHESWSLFVWHDNFTEAWSTNAIPPLLTDTDAG